VRRKKKNIILEKLLVEDYAAGGKSLAKVDGKVIFIENVVPGDVVDVRLMKNKKDWAEAVPIYTHSLSADRVTPFCSHFGVCGGCQWQMLPYEKQLQYKHKQVEETLKRIGKVALPECLPILGAAETEHYRNKVEYTFGNKEFTKEKPPQTPPKEGLLNTQAQLFEETSIIEITKDANTTTRLTQSNSKIPLSGGWGGRCRFSCKRFF